jgi:type I restriction enzyme, S subunit
MPESTTVSIGDLVNSSYLSMGDGYRTKRSEHGKPGLPILRVAEVLDGRIAPDFADFVSDSYRSAMGAKISQPGDVILTTKGTVGRVAIMPADGSQFVYSPQVCYFRTESGSPLASQYLYYWFKSESFWRQARSLKSQTDMADYINLADIKSLEIALPSKAIQAAVTSVLAALDDKIAVNEKIAATCDQLRSAHLHCWMKSNAQMVKEHPLSSVAKFVNGRAFTKDATGSGRMVIRIAEINSGPGPSTVYNDIEVPSVHLARPGDVLFAWSGSLVVARWFRPEGIINQHIFKVIPDTGIPVWLIFELVNAKLSVFKSVAADKATTMGHIQRQHLDELVDVPVRESIPELDDTLKPLWDRALAAEQESLKLAEMRDMLLARLMSGEVRVRDAEKVVEKVT